MLLSRKIDGRALDESAYRSIIGDIVVGRFEDQQISDFLVAVSRLWIATRPSTLRARADFSTSIEWGSDLVVDKHSMGGIPGSRITMVVIPIVAAHG